MCEIKKNELTKKILHKQICKLESVSELCFFFWEETFPEINLKKISAHF